MPADDSSTSTVKLSWGKNANKQAVSSHSLEVLTECLAKAGESDPIISSTARTPVDQARAMCEALESKGAGYWRSIYKAPGQRVIDVYVHAKEQYGGDLDKVRKLMLAKIYEEGPGNVSRHCADYTKLNVIDIGAGSLKNQKKAYDTLVHDKRVSKVIFENGVALHVEIPQPEDASGDEDTSDNTATETAPKQSTASGGAFDLWSAEGRAAFKEILPERSRPYADFLLDSGKKHGVNPFALWGMMERETSSGTSKLLDKPGPGGKGDGGHGRGLMQIDDRGQKEWVESHDWADPALNVDFGAKILRGFVDAFQAKPKTPGVNDANHQYLGPDVRPLAGDALTHASIAAYNAGWIPVLRKLAVGEPADKATAGHDYSSWVMKHMSGLIDQFDQKHGTSLEKTVLPPKSSGGAGKTSSATPMSSDVDFFHLPPASQALEACLDPGLSDPLEWLKQNTPEIAAEPAPPYGLDAEIEALCLTGHARDAAYALRQKFGDAIKFTSGFRPIDHQAAAMAAQQHASHVVRKKNQAAGKKAKNPSDEDYLLSFAGKWANGPNGQKVKKFESQLVQKMHDWCKAHEKATRDEMFEAFHKILKQASLDEVMKVTKHVAGRAFDLEPLKGEMADMGKKVMSFIGRGSNEGEGKLAGKSVFVTREGNLDSWHVHFDPKDGDLSHDHLVKKHNAHQAKQALDHVQLTPPSGKSQTSPKVASGGKITICPCCWKRHCKHCKGTCKRCQGHGVIADVALSEHFWLSEFLWTDTGHSMGVSNYPDKYDEVVSRLKSVCTLLLEPLRGRFGPLHINSGYRSHDINNAVGGSTTSAHSLGWAADVTTADHSATFKDMILWMRDQKKHHGMKYDQLIWEKRGAAVWLHVGYKRGGGAQRLEEVMTLVGSTTALPPFNEKLPAVQHAR